MKPASLGLTCKDALVVFSQNETLRLQGEVRELQAEIQQMREQLEWACNVMHEAGIRTKCWYTDCSECKVDLNDCTCPLATCRCKDCCDDRELQSTPFRAHLFRL